MKSFFFLIFLSLTLPAFAQTAAPENFNHQITHDGQTITVNFTKFSVRGPLYDVVLQTADETDFVDHPHDAVVRTYLGSVAGQPGTIAAGIIRADGEILARVTFADGTEWQDVDGTVTLRGSAVTSTPSSLTIPAGGAGSDLIAADIFMDLPYPQMISSGGTAATALEVAEFSMVCINAYFIRDAAIINRIGLVIIRMDADKDPYMGQTSTQELLTELRTQTPSFLNNADSTRGNHDLGLTASTQVGGGLAFVGAVGANNGVSSNGANSNGDFTVVGRHEIGHNWGSNHFEGGGIPEGNTIMSGNSLGRFSSGELAKIIAHRESRLNILDNLGNVAPPVPPRAAHDVALVELASPPVTISPLLNDNDTNGGTLTLLNHDSSSALGHTVIRNGDDLTIPVSQHFNTQADRTSYTIQDNTLKTSQADVFIKTYMDGEVLGHWTFENDNSQALDSSSFNNHAVLHSDAFIEDGVLHLDGESDQASTTLIKSVTSNAITYSAMIYRDGEQNDFAGIVFQNTDGNSTGLNLGNDNELRYHWDSSTHWGYNSGLTVPDQTWTFVALVIEPDTATFYMDDGINGMQTVSRTSTHVLKPHTAYSLGRNTFSSSRTINGMLDDARVIDRALSAAEITSLATQGLSAYDPTPLNGSASTVVDLNLKWTSSTSSQDRLYFSNNYLSTRDATIGSPEDLGLITSNSHGLIGLSPGHYYWRIDTTLNGVVTKGNLWTFQVTPKNLVVDLSLDTADDFIDTGVSKTQDSSGNDLHGTLLNVPPHLTGNCGECCGFNLQSNANQAISLGTPSNLNFGSDTDFTLVMWVRPSATSGDQVFLSNKDWDSGSNPGYTIGTNTNLRIEWNIGDGSNRQDYDGPADQLTLEQWSHVAVSHDRDADALIYLDGVLVSTEAIGSIGNIDSGLPTQLAADGEGDYDFKGSLDEVKIFAQALSATDIATLYQQSTSYYKWAGNYFNGLDLTDTAVAGPSADPTKDGVPNLLSYAFQTNPHAPDRSLFPTIQDRDFSFTRIKGGDGTASYRIGNLSYTVETSSTLEENSWSSDSSLWEEIAPREDGPNNTERLRLRPLDSNAPKLFFRIKLDAQ